MLVLFFSKLIFSKKGTIFDQRGQTCRWWYLVDCQQSEIFYNFVEEEFQEDINGRTRLAELSV